MKDSKDTKEIKDSKDEMSEIAAETRSDAPERMATAAAANDNEDKLYYQPAESEAKKADAWGNRGITRKFLIASLALALLLNAVLTVGMSALFGRHGIRNKSGFSDNQSSRPNFEQFGGRGYGGGRMMPPGAPPDNNQSNNQNAAPDSNQNAAPDTNQDNSQNNTQNDTQAQGTSFDI